MNDNYYSVNDIIVDGDKFPVLWMFKDSPGKIFFALLNDKEFDMTVEDELIHKKVEVLPATFLGTSFNHRLLRCGVKSTKRHDIPEIPKDFTYKDSWVSYKRYTYLVIECRSEFEEDCKKKRRKVEKNSK